MSASDTLTLQSGSKMPVLGLGTWKSKPGEVGEAVKAAVRAGYRHIDCAFVYGNEGEIGKALKDLYEEKVVTRDQLWITSKLWNTKHEPQDVEPALKKSIELLQCDYLDLYLIHWPHSFVSGEANFPTDENGKIKYSYVDFVDTWKALEPLVAKGLTKNIGFSNFNSKQIQRILDVATVKPSALQIETHPYFNQEKLIAFAKSHGLVVTAYSPLGSPDRPWAKSEDPSLMDDPRLHEIAKKYNKSPAQVLIKWAIQRGISVIPKSVSAERIKANFDIFDFKISDEDMKTLLGFHKNWRACPLDRDREHPHYPFNEEF